MYKRICLLLSLLLLITSCTSCVASAEMFGGSQANGEYNLGLEHFANEKYADAAACFKKAGNVSDAKKWAYYCEAIDSVVSGKGTANELNSAHARFTLLARQSFQQADQWAKYCEGRAFEQAKLTDDAEDRYSQILIHDSIERYLACCGKSDLIESTQSVRQRMLRDEPIAPSASHCYQTGLVAYDLENYHEAADYFCLAGNYEDARLWRCYCLAISLIIDDDAVGDAATLFRLLEGQGFEAASQWLTYCRGRELENLNMTKEAIQEYEIIFLHDSSDRYLRLKGID